MKKIGIIISLILSMFIFLAAGAQDTPEVFTFGDWEYQANDTGWTITAYKGNENNIIIPDSFDGTPVTQLADELFTNYLSLESVVIPGSVTAMGKNIFEGCSGLKDVSLSLNAKAIPEGAFKYCTSLENIAIPTIVTSVGKEAFMDCVKLTSITLPANVATVGESAFDNCQSLRTVYVSRDLSTVNANAFRGTPWLNDQTDEFVMLGRGILLRYNGNDRHVDIPYGTVYIANAFDGNNVIESVTLPETVQKIMHRAFADAVNLSSVNIPEYVSNIGTAAFLNCRRLVTVELPGSVKTLGANAFSGCEILSSLDLPGSVKSIPQGFAANCPALTELRIPASVIKIHKSFVKNSTNVEIQIVPGSPAEEILQGYEIPYTYTLLEQDGYYYRAEEEGVSIVRYAGMLYDVVIPSEINGLPVVSIGTAAFQNNQTVRSVFVPLTVRSIGDWAFSYMESLETVSLGLGLESIGANAFTGSPHLWEVSVPRGVTSIGDSAFEPAAGTKICADDSSAAAGILASMGYTVSSADQCSVTFNNAQWAVSGEQTGVLCDCSVCGGFGTGGALAAAVTGQADNVDVIRIPDDMTSVTANLVVNAGTELVLVIPGTVTEIDPAILYGRTVTIVGESGSAAEAFAREHSVKFIVRISTWLGK